MKLIGLLIMSLALWACSARDDRSRRSTTAQSRSRLTGLRRTTRALGGARCFKRSALCVMVFAQTGTAFGAKVCPVRPPIFRARTGA